MRFWHLTVFLALVSVMAHAADSDTDSLRNEIRAMRQAYEGRISALESEIKDLHTTGATGALKQETDRRVNAALERSLSGDSSDRSILTTPGNVVHCTSQLTLGGYTEFTYINRQGSVDQFNQLRTVAQIGAKINDRIHFFAEFEQENGAVTAGPEATDAELELEQGYLDFDLAKGISFRAGMVLVPVGRYNLYHEGFVNNLVDRPLVDRRIIGTTWFDEGAGIHGQPLDTEKLGLSYEMYILNPCNADEVSPENGFRDIRLEGKAPHSRKKAAAGRVAFEPARSAKWFADYLEVGVSGYVSGFDGFKGENDVGEVLNLKSGTVDISAFDVTWEKWSGGFRAEAAFAHADSGATSLAQKQDGWGYYAEGYYKFWPKFLNGTPMSLNFKDPKLVLAARYDWVDMDRDSADHRNVGRMTVGLGYRPLPNTVFKFDYQYEFSTANHHGEIFEETGTGKRTDAYLFSVTTGF